MNNKLLLFIFSALSSLLIFTACKKLNESTTLGDDVIPGVDGVTTFDTSLSVEAFNHLFTSTDDSFTMSRLEDHVLGYISNDPLFGKTTANLFLQLKPPFYKYTFLNKSDSLSLDSVVLVLGYHNTYGDTTVKQRVRVYEIEPFNIFRIDSAYQIHQEYFTYSNQLGVKEFFPHELNDSVKAFDDTAAANQLRIRLDNSFGDRLLNYDSTNAYASDSAFSSNLRGFAIVPDVSFGGNALMSFGLVNEPNTKLAIYYRYIRNGQEDTTVAYFNFTGSAGEHNYIKRDLTGTPLLAAIGGSTPDDLIYLQNVPGTYSTIRVPGLKDLSNRIIHRAELIVEEVYDISDKTFPPPAALYLDLFDSSLMKYKTVPYDFVPDAQGIYLFTFGMYGRSAADGFGNPIRRWTFNLSRYVQNIVTKKEPVHDMRLLAHRYVHDQIRENNFNNTGSFASFQVGINPVVAFGRVRVGGSNHPTQRMRLRIVYTKI